MGWFPRFNANNMQLKRLIKQLKLDEGVRAKAYHDSEGLLTVGIGHLIKDTDPEWVRALKAGDLITIDQINSLFENDLAIAISDFKVIFNDWETIPAEVQEILVNMIFNLGRIRFLGFKKLILAVYEQKWDKAADEMQDSKWFAQVGNRAKRLVSQMRSMV